MKRILLCLVALGLMSQRPLDYYDQMAQATLPDQAPLDYYDTVAQETQPGQATYPYQPPIPTYYTQNEIQDLRDQYQRFRRRAQELKETADSLRKKNPQEAKRYDRLAQTFEKRAYRAAVELSSTARNDEVSQQNIESARKLQTRQRQEDDFQRKQALKTTIRERQERQLANDSWHYTGP